MKVSFEEFVKDKTTCDIDKLDLAVMNGIRRAKGQILDKKKILKIVLATAATLFITINFRTNEQLQKNMQDYFLRNTKINEESSKMIQNYIGMAQKVLIEYF